VPRFNPDKLSKAVSEIRKAVARLNALKQLDKELFLNDPDRVGSAKYHFVIAIEAAITICNHIISQNGFRAPENYADTFQVLAENGAFDKAFSQELGEMAKFRNRLVHLYWEVDDNLVHEILQNRLEDFGKFLTSIAGYLKLNTL